MNDSFFPLSETSRPYFICAPSYTRFSAGVKALHLLCHHLNERGYPAFLIQYPFDSTNSLEVNPHYHTPVVTAGIFYSFEKAKIDPIFVYPDTIVGNPFQAKTVVRYLLHYAGKLGGESSFPKTDLIFSYTKKIAEESNQSTEHVLFMPVIDTTVFYLDETPRKRKGSCFYASKYRNFHSGALLDITEDSVEITRYQTDSQTPEEIAELFRSSEVFYTYEDTSLATEAILCGCPVVFIPNEFMTTVPLATNELGSNGVAIGCGDDAFNRAKQTVDKAKDLFFVARDKYWVQLDFFINATQAYEPNRESFLESFNLIDAIDLGLSLTGCSIFLPDGRSGVITNFRKQRHVTKFGIQDDYGVMLEPVVVSDYELFVRLWLKRSNRKFYNSDAQFRVDIGFLGLRNSKNVLSLRGALRFRCLIKKYSHLATS